MLHWESVDPGFIILPFLAGLLFFCGKIIWAWGRTTPIKSWWSAAIILLVLLIRLPVTLFNEVTNVDEAQTIAHALTLVNSPIPWKSLDFTTNGPLNAYIFFLPHWLGLRLDYLVSHLILLSLHALLCWSLYLSMRNWFGKANAAVAMIPVWIFMALVQASDFTHQSSEIWSCVSLSIALALFSRLSTSKSVAAGYWSWFFLGVFLGLVPFGKPQGTPPALMAALGILIFMIAQIQSLGKSRLTLFIIGGFFAPLTMLGIIWYHGVWLDFYNLYINANLHYASVYGESGLIPWFLMTWGKSNGVAFFFYVFLALFVAGLFWKSSNKPLLSAEKWLGIWLVLITYFGAYAVERAGRQFPHYMLLFLFPGVFLLLGWAVNFWSTKANRVGVVAVAFIFLTCIAGYKNASFYTQFAQSILDGNSWRSRLSPTAEFVNQFVKKGDYLTVYGWSNEYYVQTQLPSATRTVTIYQHTSVWPELYTPYYADDLEKNKPAVIIDALDASMYFLAEWVNRKKYDPEHYPWLSSFLKKNYTLVNVIEKNRIYVRNDRLK